MPTLPDTGRRVELDVACTFDGRPKYLVAAAAGLNPSMLSRFLSGRQAPTREQMERIAAALATDPAALFPGEYSSAAAS